MSASGADDYASPAARTRRRYILAACMMAQFMAAVEATIVSTALPTIVADLGGFHLFSWVFAAYLLAQAASMPVYGRLADIYGRKIVFLAGASLFLLGSAACGFAWGMIPLIVLRTIQGLGSGAVQSIAWTILGDTYRPRDRAVVQGYLSSVFGASALAGPFIGGFIVEHLYWPLVFWINVPVSIATMTVIAILLKERLAPARREIDYLGALLLMIGVGAAMVVLTQARDLDGPAVLGLGTLAVLALGLLVLQERRTPLPIVPFRLWRAPLLIVCNIGSFMIGVLMMCNVAFLPTFVQGAMGLSPAIAGLALGASSISWTFGTFGAGRVMNKSSYRAAAVLGGIVAVAGGALLLTADQSTGWVWAACGAAVLGLGMGFSNTTFVVAVQTAVGWGDRGAATSGNLFLRTIGQSVGAALFGAVFNLAMTRQEAPAGDEINRLMQPATRILLDPAIVSRLSDAIAGSMHLIYLVAAAMTLVVLTLGFRIPAGLSPAHQPILDEAPHPAASD